MLVSFGLAALLERKKNIYIYNSIFFWNLNIIMLTVYIMFMYKHSIVTGNKTVAQKVNI
jgi:hypothetical protein